jgi:hypothetical protein
MENQIDLVEPGCVLGGEVNADPILEVEAGNQHASKHSAPGLWALLARLGRTAWPCLLRGDCDWGTEANMSRAEREGLPYLLKLRLTRNAKRLIKRAMSDPGWVTAGQGRQGKASLRLVGWSRQRRVILLRRPIERTVAVIDGDGPGRQLDLYFGEITGDPAAKVFEYGGAGNVLGRRGADSGPVLSRPGGRARTISMSSSSTSTPGFWNLLI